MSSTFLKIIAMITMFIDHAGMMLFNNNEIMRFIGRIAFPLYALLLVDSFLSEKKYDNNKHTLRLLILAAISEIPFDYIFHSNTPYQFQQNVIFTLLLGLIMMNFLEKTIKIVEKALILIIFSGLAIFLSSDYTWTGILLIFLFYIWRKNNSENKAWIIPIMSIFLLSSYVDVTIKYGFKFLLWAINEMLWVNVGVLLVIPIVLFYNGKDGWSFKGFSYFYRLFYPLHMIVIFFIEKVL